jgi:hypothetical protein
MVLEMLWLIEVLFALDTKLSSSFSDEHFEVLQMVISSLQIGDFRGWSSYLKLHWLDAAFSLSTNVA